MRTYKFFLILFCLFISHAVYAKTENAFYVLHDMKMARLKLYLTTIEKNHVSIHLLISQAFQIDDQGSVSGYLNQELIDLSKKHSIKLMAMITNKGFDPEKVHAFLSSPKAEVKALGIILATCQKYSLDGVQFDFEGVSVDDKSALTEFYKNAAELLHKHGFHISYAIIPGFPEEIKQSAFLKKHWEKWAGAYDLAALGKYVDFITLMAYNQHPQGTIPGPNASISYVEATIKNTLKEIPANKISLGIPVYSLYWYSSPTRISTQQMEICYQDAMKLIKKNNAALIWSKRDQINYARYERRWLDEYVFLEDAESFAAKYNLIKKYKLYGISVFRIGTEDSRIWKCIP